MSTEHSLLRVIVSSKRPLYVTQLGLNEPAQQWNPLHIYMCLYGAIDDGLTVKTTPISGAKSSPKKSVRSERVCRKVEAKSSTGPPGWLVGSVHQVGWLVGWLDHPLRAEPWIVPGAVPVNAWAPSEQVAPATHCYQCSNVCTVKCFEWSQLNLE